MKNTKKVVQFSFVVVSIIAGAASAYAGCDKVQGGAKSAFTGDSLSGLSVDKKAMATLNKQFPQLSITEKVFTGNIQTCTDCKDNYVTCSE